MSYMYFAKLTGGWCHILADYKLL